MSVPSDDVLRRLGASLREIDPSALQSDPEEGSVRWFLGDSGTELFAWTREGAGPYHLELVFARLQVEWTEAKGLITRRFRGGGSTAGGRYDAYLLEAEEGRDPAILEAAKQLLEASTLPEEIRSPIFQALSAGG